MLGKLFKHEFIDLFKKTILFFSIVLGLSLLVFTFKELAKTYFIFSIINTFFYIGYILSIAGILIYSIFYPVTRFYKSMLKDEGYLTHTLPVTTGQLLFAKLTVAFVLFFASFLLAIGSLLLTSTISIELVNGLISLIHESKFFAYLFVFVYLVLYYFGMVMMFITALVLGHSRSSKKGLNSFFAGLIIYGIQQGLGSITVLLLFLTTDLSNPESVNVLSIFLISMSISLVLIIGETIVSYQYLKKKLNLE